MKVQVQKYFLLILVLAVTSVLFHSCSVQKRKYNKGFYVQHKYHKQKPSKLEKEKTELYCSAEQVFVLAENKIEFKESQTFSLNSSSKIKKKSFKSKEFLNKFDFHPRKESKTSKIIFPDKPNKNTKYKVSIFQINVMGLISVCLIPIMIVAFFIPGAALLIWSTLIAGALLALLCAFMIQKRPGAWMAGLAMGLWGLILLYFILLLFVF